MSSSAMHVAKTGLNSQQTKMQVIANNLANVSTTGFKRDRANFETLLYQVRRVAGDQADVCKLLDQLAVLLVGERFDGRGVHHALSVAQRLCHGVFGHRLRRARATP